MMKIRRENRTLWIVNIILVISLVSIGCLILFRGLGPMEQEHASEAGGIPVAYFNKKPISDSEWEQELKRKYGQEVLLHILNRKSVFEEAEAQDIHITSDDVTSELKTDMMGYDSEEAYYHEMETQLGLTPEDVTAEMNYKLTLEKIAILGIHITDQEIDSYLAENRDQFEPSKKYQLSVVKLASQAEAEDIMDQLEQGANFAEMAKEHSIDISSRDKGGRIGAVESNDPFLPKKMLEAAASLQQNEIAGPFQWDDDYVVIQLTDVFEEEQEDSENIRESIRKLLALNEAMPLSELEKNLREKYDVRIVTRTGL